MSMTKTVAEGDRSGQCTGTQNRDEISACSIVYNLEFDLVGNHEGLARPMDGAEASNRELPSHHA